MVYAQCSLFIELCLSNMTPRFLDTGLLPSLPAPPSPRILFLRRTPLPLHQELRSNASLELQRKQQLELIHSQVPYTLCFTGASLTRSLSFAVIFVGVQQ